MEIDWACRSCQKPEDTIDQCCNFVLYTLSINKSLPEVSSTLKSFNTYHDKVLHVYKILKEQSLFPMLKTNIKNDDVALYYRNQGNNLYKKYKHYEAWQAYNLSLLYAYGTSEHFIYAVSNRSAVFFDMGKYEECMIDLDFVFSTEYPENLRGKLMARKNKCQALLDAAKSNMKIDPNDSKIADILSLKGPKDEKYVCASSKLKVVYTKEMGRHVIASEDIKVGEVLAKEEPFLKVLLKPQFLFCCAYCLSRSMNLYPCLSCTYTMYCSVECRENAFKDYHIAECGLMPNLVSMEFTKLEWLALRTLIRSRMDVSDWIEMFKVVEEAEANVNTDLWGCVKVNGKWVYDSKYYTSIHTLETNHKARSLSDLFQKCVSSAVFIQFLSQLHFLKSTDAVLGQRAIRYVCDVLLRHMMTAPTNMHSISANIENDEGNFVDECQIASGAYAFHSLLNHSCAPNVVRYVKLGTSEMSLIAIRPIKKGMQIYDNYGETDKRNVFVSQYDPTTSMRRSEEFTKYHHALHDRSTRQSKLKSQYKFDCACEACVDDWPTHGLLREGQAPAAILMKKEQVLTSEVLNKLMKADKETAVKSYEPLCELIEALDPYAPCKELAECQEAMKQCLAIFQGVIPVGYTREVKWGPYAPCTALGGPPHIGKFMKGPSLALRE